MSIIFGILTVVFGYLSKINPKFKIGVIGVITIFMVYFALNNNKLNDFLYYFFFLGIAQVIIAFNKFCTKDIYGKFFARKNK